MQLKARVLPKRAGREPFKVVFAQSCTFKNTLVSFGLIPNSWERLIQHGLEANWEPFARRRDGGCSRREGLLGNQIPVTGSKHGVYCGIHVVNVPRHLLHARYCAVLLIWTARVLT